MKEKSAFLLIPILVLFTVVPSVSAQQIRNLHFEEPGNVRPDLPIGWLTRGIDHQVSLDSSVAHSGQYSFRSRALTNRASGYGIGRLRIPPELIRGKNLGIKIWVRSKNITGGNAIIRSSVYDSTGNSINHIQFPDGGILGSTSWNQYEANLNIDTHAQLAYLSVFHGGNGTVWFDDIELTIDGIVYDPDSYKPWTASTAEIEWLQNNLIPLKTDNPDSDFADLDKLKPLFKGAEIIGLGEGTHGTREFFRMKHRLVKWFAEREDTILFAIEANMPEAKAINKYIHTGAGNPKEMLSGLYFWTWNTEEVLELIEWMRSYNKSGKGRIEFWGFDMQYPQVAADSVMTFINRAEPSYHKTLEQLYRNIAGPAALRRMSQDSLQKLHASVFGVVSHLEKNREKYLKTFDQTKVEWVIQNARIVEQSVSRFLRNGDSRDKSMAENIKWIYDHHASDSKIIIWAHNLHIQNASGAIGQYLKNRYKDAYRNVGFAFGEGTYSAVLGPQAPVKSYPAQPPIKGSVEYAMHSVNTPRFALDLREGKNDSLGKWLNTSKPFRNIGSIARDLPYTATPVAEYFDILIYFDQTTASHSFGRPN